MKVYLMILTVCSVLISVHNSSIAQGSNPLLQEFDTPYGVPPFDLIKEHHFILAIQSAMEDQNKIIEEIINEPEPTFESTFERLEKSGYALNRITSIFYNLSSANTNPEIQRIAKEIAPLMSAHNDNIYLNGLLYKKLVTQGDVNNQSPAVKRLEEQLKEIETQARTSGDPAKKYEAEEIRMAIEEINKENIQSAKGFRQILDALSPEQQRLCLETLKKFKRSGAELNEFDKDRLKEINSRLSLLSVQFGENVLEDINEFKLIVENKKDLAGLPQSAIDAAEEAAKEADVKGYLFTLSPPSMAPILKYAENRTLREKIMKANLSKGATHPDRMNAPLIKEMVALREEKAKLLGYPSHAHYVLENSMSKTPENVLDLLDKLWGPALKMAEAEANAIQTKINEEQGGFNLTAWDWAYYTEKIRQEKYDLNAEELRPYFELESVKQGMFNVIEKLWGLQFKPLNNMPVYHKDVQVVEVTEANGDHLGVLYMDFFPRSSKRGGAWMSSFRKQHITDGERIAPVITIVCNFTKPTGSDPSLLSMREVETMYHEMGHALHGLLSNVTYNELSGTSVSRDFVELPSQIMENWATERSLLEQNARHYKTGKPIPAELLDKVEASNKFNMGFTSVEYLAASYLDMAYHSDASFINVDPKEAESKVSSTLRLPEYIPYRYKSTYFSHIFSGGYSSGYYSYIWSEVLDADAYELFKSMGDIFSPKVAHSFRTNILEKGNTEEPDILYRTFRGSDPQIKALLERRGFN